MAELDLAQKIEMREIFWRIGASTRLDVKLSALVPRSGRGRADSEEWTDLDVLAIEYSPLGGMAFAVADCKTLKGRVAERVFWLRGVADLFGARSAYLVPFDARLGNGAGSRSNRFGSTVVKQRSGRLPLIEAVDEVRRRYGEPFAVIAGAGISRRGPSFLPTTTDFYVAFAEVISRAEPVLAPAARLSRRLVADVRFELLMERLRLSPFESRHDIVTDLLVAIFGTTNPKFKQAAPSSTSM